MELYHRFGALSSTCHQNVAIFYKKNILKSMNNLYQLREEKNLSQEEIAQFLGVTRQAYSRYEREERELNYNSLKKLSKFFDVSIDYLLGNSEYYYPDRVSDSASVNGSYSSEERDLEISQIEKTLLEAFRKLLPETQDFILKTTESLKEKDQHI